MQVSGCCDLLFWGAHRRSPKRRWHPSLGIAPDNAILQIAIEEPKLEPGAGESLVNEFKAIKPGKEKKCAVAFEQWCQRAMKFLFGNQFGVWIPQ
jgi:hypothetical protein